MLPQSNRNRKLERRETGCQHIRSRTEEQTGNSLRHTCRRFPPLRLAPTDHCWKQRWIRILLFVGPIHGRRRSPANPEPTNPPRTGSPGSHAEIWPTSLHKPEICGHTDPGRWKPCRPTGQPVWQILPKCPGRGSKTGMYNLRDCQRPLYQYAGRRSDAFLNLSQ